MIFILKNRKKRIEKLYQIDFAKVGYEESAEKSINHIKMLVIIHSFIC